MTAHLEHLEQRRRPPACVHAHICLAPPIAPRPPCCIAGGNPLLVTSVAHHGNAVATAVNLLFRAAGPLQDAMGTTCTLRDSEHTTDTVFNAWMAGSFDLHPGTSILCTSMYYLHGQDAGSGVTVSATATAAADVVVVGSPARFNVSVPYQPRLQASNSTELWCKRQPSSSGGATGERRQRVMHALAGCSPPAPNRMSAAQRCARSAHPDLTVLPSPH